MDTIKLSAGGHEISFSKKSLTIDDKVYLYTGISAIKHSSAKKLYLFKYEDQWHKLPYDEKNQTKVATIFKRVAEMNAKRQAKADAPKAAETPAAVPPAEAEVPAEKPAEELPSLAQVMAEHAGLAAAAANAETEAAEEPAVEPTEEAIEEPKEEPKEEIKDEPTEEAVQETEDPQEGEETNEGEEPQLPEEVQGAEEDAESIQRKKRLKKAFGSLAIVIAIFILAGVAYFFIFGTSKDASQSPNTESTHEYNDIDELIDEMNE